MTIKPKTRNPSTSSGPVAPAVVVPVDRGRDRKLTQRRCTGCSLSSSRAALCGSMTSRMMLLRLKRRKLSSRAIARITACGPASRLFSRKKLTRFALLYRRRPALPTMCHFDRARPHAHSYPLSHLEASRAVLGLAAAARGALTLNRNGNDDVCKIQNSFVFPRIDGREIPACG